MFNNMEWFFQKIPVMIFLPLQMKIVMVGVEILIIIKHSQTTYDSWEVGKRVN